MIVRNINLKEAVDDAIEDCIRNHVLEEFFRSRKDEARKVTHLDYTWEKREKLIRREEYEDGKAKGKADAILELLEDLGEIPEEIQKRILVEKDLQILKKWLKLAAKADSVEEFQER